MQTGLGCLFALIFGFFIFLFSIAHTLVRTIYSVLGFTPRRESGRSSRQSGNAQGQGASTAHSKGNSRQRRSGKIFRKDEGEYIDFEEIP